jgi:hypothetical protein
LFVVCLFDVKVIGPYQYLVVSYLESRQMIMIGTSGKRISGAGSPIGTLLG